MADSMNMPSDVTIEDVIIIGGDGQSIDVTDLVTEIVIYESLGDPTLHGKVQFVDAAGVLTRFQLLGQERFRFTVKRFDFEKKSEFFISSIDSVTLESETTSIYTVSIIEEAAIVNIASLVSQSYEGTVTSAITDIYRDYLGVKLNYADQTTGDYRFVIPNWNPYRAINWLAQRAVDSNEVPMVLVNTWRNGTSLLSYDTMMNRRVSEQFYQNVAPTTESSEQGNAFNFRRIMQKPQMFNVITHGNAMEQMARGTYGQTILNIDTVSKTLSSFEYESDEDYEAKPRLAEHMAVNKNAAYGEGKPITKNTKTIQTVMYNQGPSHGDNFRNYDVGSERIIPYHNNYQGVLSNYMYEISIHGRFDIETGSIVEVFLPSNKLQNKTDPNDIIDRKRSGKYLVTACAHKFNTDKYTLTLEVSRDGFGEEYAVE